MYFKPNFAGNVSGMIAVQGAMKFNGGGHLNHSIFWCNLSPNGGGVPTGDLANAIERDFGSFDNLKTQMSAKTVAIQGSGWGWLVSLGMTVFALLFKVFLFLPPFLSLSLPLSVSLSLQGFDKGRKQLVISTCANQDPLEATTGTIYVYPYVYTTIYILFDSM